MAEVLPIRGPRDELAPELPEPPDHLSDEAAKMWKSVVREWHIGTDGLPILRASLEMWDLYQAARRTIAEQGVSVVNPDSGIVRQHPAHVVARDSLREYRQLWRQLNLQPPTDT